jgi:hypothetical protein
MRAISAMAGIEYAQVSRMILELDANEDIPRLYVETFLQKEVEIPIVPLEIIAVPCVTLNSKIVPRCQKHEEDTWHCMLPTGHAGDCNNRWVK